MEMSLRLDPERARQVGHLLLTAFHSQGILGETSMPEHILPNGVERGTREYLHFITLTVAIDYMRNADALWESSRQTYADPLTRYLYSPSQVVQTDTEKLITDMRKYGLVKKPRKDADTWQTICASLTRHFDSDAYNLLERAKFDAPLVLATVRNPRYRFPFLKGPKIGPLWVRMLEDSWQGRHLANLDELPIPVDTHIATATVMMGCVQGPFEGQFEELRDAVVRVWFDACHGGEHYPLQFDEPLWHLSRRGCRRTRRFPCEYRAQCPVKEYCSEARLAREGNWVSVP
jgi:hypothetical protein